MQSQESDGSIGHGTPSGLHDRALTGPVMQFDIQSELGKLREQARYTGGVPTGTTLVKESSLRIVLMAMAAGTRMEQHHASGPISIQALDGRFRLALPDGTVEMEPGMLLALEPNLPHDVEAIDDAAFLLTIGRTTYHEVSDRHEHPR